MINIIIKKISNLFVLAVLVTLINIISAGHNAAMADCTWTDPVPPATTGTCSGTYTPAGTTTSQTCSATSQAACNALSAGAAGSVTGDENKNMLVSTLCNIFKIATGNGGKAFAAFAIISLGIGFFTGKVSWGLMIGVAAGIAAMFGAPTIVAAISGQNSYNCQG